jgi:mannose-6-phosphate isomerase-like protein (cupin superfamily)
VPVDPAADTAATSPPFVTRTLATEPDEMAPDGSEVRVLAATRRASTAHFLLGPGATAVAVAHHTVDEIWYVLRGSGQLWRRQGDREEIIDLVPGVSASIPLGTAFQFRAAADDALEVLGATTPPWPGDDEAFVVEGPWTANV